MAKKKNNPLMGQITIEEYNEYVLIINGKDKSDPLKKFIKEWEHCITSVRGGIITFDFKGGDDNGDIS